MQPAYHAVIYLAIYLASFLDVYKDIYIYIDIHLCVCMEGRESCRRHRGAPGGGIRADQASLFGLDRLQTLPGMVRE